MAPAIHCQSATEAPPAVNPDVANLPGGLFVDRFESVNYGVDYRSEGGNLSNWLQVTYSDGTVIDINVHDIGDEHSSGPQAIELFSKSHVGPGGRIFPQRMNATTTPRLAAAKKAAIETMEEYNFEFIKATLPAVLFIVGSAVGLIAPAARTTPRLPAVRRIPIARPPAGPAATPHLEPAPAARAPAASKPPLEPAARPRGPGSQEASARAAAESEGKQVSLGPLTAEQQQMATSLVNEHPGLSAKVASEAVRGAASVAGRGGKGADVLLLNGGGRELTVHTGAVSAQSLGSHLLSKAAQSGTTEIFMQVNSSGATREMILQIIPEIRTGLRGLAGRFVKIFGPDGSAWWSGVFRGVD
jgi:hypothetical protein